ncbi:hypothetical protein LBMAG46_38540 [Planctomycetia bacterium]|nr:hypothetical protein LBMAG46_38540 [Planctomycetia bacterium]
MNILDEGFDLHVQRGRPVKHAAVVQTASVLVEGVSEHPHVAATPGSQPAEKQQVKDREADDDGSGQSGQELQPVTERLICGQLEWHTVLRVGWVGAGEQKQRVNEWSILDGGL